MKKVLYGIWVLYLISILANIIRRFGIEGSILISGLVKGELVFFILMVIVFLLLVKIDTKLFSKISIGTAMFLILVNLFLVYRNINYYANYSYTSFGIPRFMAERTIYLSIIQILIFQLSFYPKTKREILKYKPTTILIILVFGFLIYLSKTSLRSLEYFPKNFETIFGREYKYILAMSNLPTDCSIIHPPYGANDSEEYRWESIKIQPILRYFLIPRILVNPVVFSDEKTRETLKNTNCYYFVEIAEKGSEWPKIDKKNMTISFDRYFEKQISYEKIEEINSKNPVKVYKVKLNL
jgi:hypothetical protein